MDGSSNDATLWLSIGAASLLKAEKTYAIEFTLGYAEGFTGTKLCLRYDNSAFDDFETSVPQGKSVTYKVTKTMPSDGGFWGIYFLQCTGSVTVSSVTITEVK